MKLLLQRMVSHYYLSSCDRSFIWAADAAGRLRPRRLLDVGCADGNTWLMRRLKQTPEVLCGIEGDPRLAEEAAKKGIQVASFDLNGRWNPYSDSSFDVVHSTQVIEHLHNVRLFLAEMFRVLTPGGLAVLTSENLCSLLNLCAMLFGFSPFSLSKTCGWYLGNPLGLHAGDTYEGHNKMALPELDHPAFSGITGHIRVLSVLQAKQLLERTGFVDVEVTSVGLMPLPQFAGRGLEKLMPGRGHWLLMRGRKPQV